MTDTFKLVYLRFMFVINNYEPDMSLVRMVEIATQNKKAYREYNEILKLVKPS